MMTTHTTINPTTGSEIATYDLLTAAAIEAALVRAEAAYREHRALSLTDRAERLTRTADLLEADQRRYASLMTCEMGKPIQQALAEVEKCAWVCRYYAEHGETFLADEEREAGAGRRSFVAYQPVGPVLAVMPWNYPFWQVFRFAAPALMAGNVGLLKHAKNVIGCGNAIEEVFREAGFVEGAFQHLPVETDAVAGIIADRRVRAVTLTGSEGAGAAVARAAGNALKPTVLELGGSDAFIVLADADLDRALDIGVTARTQNNGQSCIAAKRFILEAPVAETFTEGLAERMAALTVGDPKDPSTDVGPLAREDLRNEVHDQVRRAVDDGAEILTGGTIPKEKGFFYPPTVLGGVTEGTVAFDEEIFGPVASVIVAEDADDAVRLANASRFGLGGAVFTEDRAQGERVARAMESGACFINQMTKSHPNLPFGGVKDSGYGRELSRQGIRAFVNAKTIWMD